MILYRSILRTGESRPEINTTLVYHTVAGEAQVETTRLLYRKSCSFRLTVVAL